MTRDRPALRMIVGQGGSLRPADAYSESKMMRYQPDHELEIRPMPDLTYWKRRRYWQILDLVIERCETPWKSSDEAHEVLKLACGVTALSVSPQGKEVVYPGTTTTMEDPEFDDYFENAMTWLYETTNVDPETMEREADDLPGVAQHPSGEEGDGSPSEPPQAAVADPPVDLKINDPDERAMLNSSAESMSTAALKQEAIRKILDLFLDDAIDEDERRQNIALAHRWWTDKMPGHPNFVETVFATAAKVARKELPRPAATNYLFGLRDG